MEHKKITKITSSILLGTMLTYTAPVFAFTKDETVYTNLYANGNAYNTIVSDHIKNSEKEKLINDISDLLNIKNVGGDEEFSQDGNKLVWNANESDIYYQGESQKELPIECTVKYELDGTQITAEELAGETGKVKITIEYKNKDKHIVNINGKCETLYTPFVVVCGTIINNEKNTNIEIINGKAIDDGQKTTVIGISLPGLQESLGISEKTFNIPNKVEISMEAKDFELGNIITYVTPKVIEESDLELFNNLDEIYSQVNKLQSSSKQIEDGANKLKDGTVELNEGASKLKAGSAEAYAGSNMIKQEVSKSVKNMQTDTSDALDEATLTVIKNQAMQSATLTDEQKTQIANQAKTSSVLTEEQKTQIINEAKANSILTDMQKEQIEAQAKANSILTDMQKEQIKAEAKANSILTDMQKANIIAEAQKSIYPETLTDLEKQLIIGTAQNTATNTAIQTALTIAQNTATQTAVETALATAQNIATSTAIQTALTTAQNIATQTSVQTALTTAQSTAKETAAKTATQTAKQVGNEAKQKFTSQVTTQMGTLGSSLGELTEGLNSLNNGVEDLHNGTSKLEEGATTLAEGVTKFNNEGLEKICNYINGDLKDISTRAEKLEQLAEEYNNFTMLNDGSEGKLKFIMIMDSIKSEENSKQAIIVEEKKEEKENN